MTAGIVTRFKPIWLYCDEIKQTLYDSISANNTITFR